MMGWGIDFFGLLGVLTVQLAAFFAWARYKRAPLPAIFYSDISLLQQAKPGIKAVWRRIPDVLFWSAIGLLLAALADPYTKESRRVKENRQHLAAPSSKPLPVEGLAVYLVLDHSGSMGEEVLTTGANGRRTRTPKLGLLKGITEKFIMGDESSGLEGRPEDMIGVVQFARSAQVLSPLTLDHQELIKKLNEIELVRQDEQQGTSIGYAIYKTANLITATRHFAEQLESEGKPAYSIKSAVIILVTDGLQDLNPLDKGKKWRLMSVEDASEYAAENGIRLYIINVDPKFNSSDYAASRREMERFAAKTGGRFFLADDRRGLAEIYQEIDTLEKSSLPFPEGGNAIVDGRMEDRVTKTYYASWLIGISLALLLAATISRTLWLKRLP